MTVPANLIAPLLMRGIPELVYCQAWATYPGGGLSGRSVALSIGEAKPDRKVIAFIGSADGVAHSITGTPTLDGVPMTPLVQQNGVRGPGGVWIIDKPTGTTATISWTSSSGDVDGQAAATWALYGARSSTPDFSQALFSNGASVNVPGTATPCALLAVSWSWQGGAGSYGAPLTPDFTGVSYESSASGGHGQIFSPLTVAPGLSIPYNGCLFVAAWK